MGIQLEMRLCFSAKNLHLVLIKTFVRAKLQLRRSVADVDIGNGISDVLAKVARLGSLEGCSTPKEETILGAKDCPC